MKSKSKLSKLQVCSFVTSLNDTKEQTLQGGKADGGVLTVITRGLWSVCCRSHNCEN